MINPVIAKILNGHESKNLNLIKNGFQMLNFGTNFHTDMLCERYGGLSLKVNNNIYGPHDIYLRAISMNFKNLEIFDITSVRNIEDHTIVSLFSERANSLKSLKLPKYINTLSMDSIEILRNFQHLIELQIGNRMFRHRNENDNLWISVLSNLPKLKKLIIFNTGDSYFYTIFENKKFGHLEELEFKNDITLEAVDKNMLRTVAENCPNLIKFVINGSVLIENEDLNVIQKLRKLCCFTVRNCKFITKDYIEKTFGKIGVFE